MRSELAAIPSNVSEIVLTGGEPTIRKDFFEILSISSRLFGLVQVQTNARMFSYPESIDRIMSFPNIQFFIPLTAPDAKVHDSLTCSSGSFDQTVKGIRNLRSAGKQVLLNCIIVKQNLSLLPALAKLASSLKADQLQFSFIHPI